MVVILTPTYVQTSPYFEDYLTAWLSCQINLIETKTITFDYLDRFFVFDRKESGYHVYRSEMPGYKKLEIYITRQIDKTVCEIGMEAEIETF